MIRVVAYDEELAGRVRAALAWVQRGTPYVAAHPAAAMRRKRG